VPNGQRLALQVPLDISEASDLKTAMLLVLRAGIRNIAIDLSAVTFIDSVRLGVLTSGHDQIRFLGGSCHVLCTKPEILDLFRRTGLDKVLNIVPDNLTAARWEACDEPRPSTPSSAGPERVTMGEVPNIDSGGIAQTVADLECIGHAIRILVDSRQQLLATDAWDYIRIKSVMLAIHERDIAAEIIAASR
jgi:anti-sigma B factor antagonist